MQTFGLSPAITPLQSGSSQRLFPSSDPAQRYQFGTRPPRIAPLVAARLPDGTLYDREIAYVLAVASAWAYADGATLANKLGYYGVPTCSVAEYSVVNDAMLVVARAFLILSHDDGVGVLAFRGTEPANVVSWLGDADTTLRPFVRGNVHAGFYANVEALWDDVRGALERAMQGELPRGDWQARERAMPPARLPRLTTLYVTGHSLGGAMAVLAAARLLEDRSTAGLVRAVYTYGQPMVGDDAFATAYATSLGARLFRHVYDADVVPRLPPTDTDAFAHLGQAFYASGSDAIWTPAPADPLKVADTTARALGDAFVSFVARRSRRVRWWLERASELPLAGRRPRYSLDDHAPSGYVETSRRGVPVTTSAHAARTSPAAQYVAPP